MGGSKRNIQNVYEWTCNGLQKCYLPELRSCSIRNLPFASPLLISGGNLCLQQFKKSFRIETTPNANYLNVYFIGFLFICLTIYILQVQTILKEQHSLAFFSAKHAKRWDRLSAKCLNIKVLSYFLTFPGQMRALKGYREIYVFLSIWHKENCGWATRCECLEIRSQLQLRHAIYDKDLCEQQKKNYFQTPNTFWYIWCP